MDRSEFEQLVLSYLDEVNAFAHYLTDKEWEADDLVQATYRNAFERWESLSSPESCRSWLFRIARNQWTDWLRSRKAGPDLELVDPKDDERPRRRVGAEEVEQLDEKQVREALDEIPKKNPRSWCCATSGDLPTGRSPRSSTRRSAWCGRGSRGAGRR